MYLPLRMRFLRERSFPAPPSRKDGRALSRSLWPSIFSVEERLFVPSQAISAQARLQKGSCNQAVATERHSVATSA